MPTTNHTSSLGIVSSYFSETGNPASLSASYNDAARFGMSPLVLTAFGPSECTLTWRLVGGCNITARSSTDTDQPASVRTETNSKPYLRGSGLLRRQTIFTSPFGWLAKTSR